MNLAVKQESYRIESVIVNLREQCVDVCSTDYKTPELSHDEVNCLDRCTWRYLETFKIVSGASERGQNKGKK